MNYIYTDKFIYTIPPRFLKRSCSNSLPISRHLWRDYFEHFDEFHIFRLIEGVSIRLNLIQCIARFDGVSSRPIQCHWAVRIGVSSGVEYEEFGKNFLWILPYRAAMVMLQQIKIRDEEHSHRSNLSKYRPTSTAFCPAEWGCTRVTRLSHDDAWFALNVKPSALVVHPVPIPQRVVKKLTIVSVCRKKFSVLKLCDDVLRYVLFCLVSKRDYFSTLLALRATCVQFRDMVDEICRHFFRTILEAISHVFRDDVCATCDVLRLRDALVSSRISAIHLFVELKEHGESLDVFSLMRLRRGFPPDYFKTRCQKPSGGGGGGGAMDVDS